MHHDIARLRNIGIMASVDAGTSTCRERIFEAIVGPRPQSEQNVHVGPIHPAHLSHASSGTWTPRSGLFEGESTSLTFVAGTPRVVDGVLVVLDGARKTVDTAELREMYARRVPCIAFIDDVGGAEDLEAMVRELESDLGWTVLPVQLPWNDERGAHVIDVLEQRLVVEPDGGNGERARHPLPTAALTTVARLRQRIVAACAEVDESIGGAEVASLDVGADELSRALRKAALARDSRVLVVTCGSLRARRGVSLLLDALVNYLPSPAGRAPVLGVDPRRSVAVARFARDGDAFSATVFGMTDLPDLGRFTWVRVHSGTLDAGATLLVLPRDSRVRVERLFEPDIRGLVEINRAGPGAIVCVTGVDDAALGDTLSCPRAPIVLDKPPPRLAPYSTLTRGRASAAE